MKDYNQTRCQIPLILGPNPKEESNRTPIHKLEPPTQQHRLTPENSEVKPKMGYNQVKPSQNSTSPPLRPPILSPT
ncbi:hypothetical protein K458DRAFT_414718 [Lentithecium fluviatile CBS 122367]|uniref:Uncharacterized protein n=1 Tax=Lentithecium fluviatile CBS 122367 TaxID=1168545 RepID=A0A6G1JAT8_9PLEO|nr:hypothetical protein K458DRAFT_414718 [Lentithecium fluviatile CBS 122367]